MIAASSFRPFDKCPPQIVENQIRAKQSWDKYLTRVIYMNQPEPRLFGKNTSFVTAEEKPEIKSLAIVLGAQPEWGCIINADIVLGGGIKRVIDTLLWCRADCVVSRRYTIPENGQIDQSKLEHNDNGVDFFAAKPEVWRRVAQKIPRDFKLGKIVWDTWMVCFFVTEYFWSCYDITPAKAVFHPKHGDRIDQNFNVPKNEYLERSRWPRFTIT